MWVPTNVYGCCEDTFTIFILTLIVILVLVFGIFLPITHACCQEDGRERVEYMERKKWKSMPYCPGMPWKYSRERHDSLNRYIILKYQPFDWLCHLNEKTNIREFIRKNHFLKKNFHWDSDLAPKTKDEKNKDKFK